MIFDTCRDVLDGPHDESERLAALARYAILDTGPEPAFDRIARLAAHSLGTPVSLISFVDIDCLWFKARHGLDASELGCAVTFCDQVVKLKMTIVVPDAAEDPRLQQQPPGSDFPGFRFYAGAPLITPDGLTLGTLCVLDTKPRRSFSDRDQQVLSDLAAVVMDELDLRRELARREVELRSAQLRERLLKINAETPTPTDAIEAAIAAICEMTGGLVCLLFRSGSDGKQLHLLGGYGRSPAFDDSYFQELRAAKITVETSLSGIAIRAGQQIFVNKFSPELLGRYAGVGLAVQRGMRALLVTPISLGRDHYTFALGFAEGHKEAEEARLIMQDVVPTLRPLLRRMRDGEAADLFKRAVEASSDGVIITEVDPGNGQGPVVRYVNDAFLAQTGFSREEVNGQAPQFLPHADVSGLAHDGSHVSLAAGGNARQEARIYRRDGSFFWGDLTTSPMADATGWLSHWVTIQRDVTTQKNAAASLAEREAYFRHFFEQNPTPMWLFDVQSLAFLDVNQAAVAAYGWSRDEFLAKTILDIRPDADHDAVRAIVKDLPDISGSLKTWIHVTASGAERQVQIRSQRIEFRGINARLAVVWDVTERVRAEQTAQDLALQLDAMLESISDGFFTLDTDWRFAFANPQAANIFAHAGDSLLGRLMTEVLPQGAENVLVERLGAIHRSRETGHFSYHDPMTARWFDCTAYPSANGLIVYLRDVTAGRKSEERLRLLNTAVDNLNDVILISEADPIEFPGPRIVFANAAFERLTGYSAAEILGQTPRLLQGPATSRHELTRIREAIQKFQPIRSELLNYMKDGTPYWVELDIVPVRDSSEQVTHFVAVERDVTERKRTQEVLETNEERFRLIVRASGQAAWEWDVVRDRQWWSDGLREIFQHEPEPEGAAPSVWRKYVHPDDAARVMGAVEGLRLGQVEFMNERYRFQRADGSWAWVDDRAFAIRGGDGQVIRILGCMADVSERLALEDRLRQSQKMEAVGQLTGGISHDFNNLLTIIMGSAEVLVEELEEFPQLKKLAEMTFSAAERGAELTQRLLAFSRKQPLEPKILDVGRLINGMDGLLRRVLLQDIELKIICPEGLWQVELDAGQLEAMLLNLVLNARDAMPDGGTLIIETANTILDGNDVASDLDVEPGEYVQVTVTDTGHGIPQEIKNKIFDPFFTTKEAGKGSGLGLSMVHGFVKQSKGHLRVYSEYGYGASFKIYFPKSDTECEKFYTFRNEEDFVDRRGVILVVEDEDMVRDHVTSLLNKFGYSVLSARNGGEALDILEGNKNIDLLFTDVILSGGMNGRVLAQAAREMKSDIKVLFTSGYTESSIAHHGRLDPGVELLTKPYRRDQLAAKINNILGRN